MIAACSAMLICVSVASGQPGAINVDAVLSKFPRAVRIEASAYVNGESEPNQKIQAELRPSSVLATSHRRMKPMGYVPDTLRYDSPSETIIFHPGTRRAQRLSPFLSLLGMSAVESIVSPYGFVRAMRHRAEKGEDVRLLTEGDLAVLAAPTGGVGVPALRIETERSSGRIVRVVYGEQVYRFSDYQPLPDGSEFPRRCETAVRVRGSDVAIESVVTYDRVEPIAPDDIPARPVFDDGVIIDDAIADAVTDSTGKRIAPRQGATRSGWLGVSPDAVLVGLGVLCLLGAGYAWRRLRA